MEFRDYIMKFPPSWRGVFAPLSKDGRPTLGADSWLVENRASAFTCRTSKSSPRGHHIDWRGFLEGLGEEEPTEVAGQLAFLPRILLFPVNVQRNTAAFLSDHLHEIPMPYLEDLLDSLRSCSVTDEWTKHHLRTAQDFVCRHRCPGYGSGMSADGPQSQLTRGSKDTFENVCRQIGDKEGVRDEGSGFTLQFDWLPEALSINHRTCRHSGSFASVTGKLDSGETLQPGTGVPAGPEASLENESADSAEGRSQSPEVIDDEGSPPQVPTGEGTAPEESVADRNVIGDRGQSSQVKAEVLRGQRRDVEDIGSQREPRGDDGVDTVTMDKLASLKSALRNSSGPTPELARVVVDIPIDKMEAACDILELDSTPAAGLAALAKELSGFPLELSHSSATILARRCFGQQIRDLTQTAPRTLLAAVIGFAAAFPKPAVEGALFPALAGCGRAGGSTSHSCDLVAKVMKEALSNESRVYLLSKLLSIQTLQWSDELTGLVQTSLACKLELDNRTLELFVKALEHHGNFQSSCAKFAKLLLAVINRFAKQISAAGLAHLQTLADANQTFLRKSLLAALRRVKG